jgi:uncharacterized protein YndB with AHSA1/START domain
METRTTDAGSDREIVVRRTFDAPRELVYGTFTDPERVSRWWGPEGFTTATLAMDVRPGGEWRSVMWGPDGTRYPNRLRYTAVEAPARLSWVHDEDEDGSPSFEVEVTFDVVEGGRTEVTLRQTHPTAEARERVVREHGAVEGGNQTLARLASEVEEGGVVRGRSTISTPSDTEVRVERLFDAPRRLLWAAWTDPAHLPHWMVGPDGWTMTVCEIDLRPGGAWHFVWRREDGSEMEMSGEYREVEAPERLVNTERWGGDWPETVNTLVLTEESAGGPTRLAVTTAYPTREARDAALGTGMTGGMDLSFGRLDAHLEAARAGSAS